MNESGKNTHILIKMISVLLICCMVVSAAAGAAAGNVMLLTSKKSIRTITEQALNSHVPVRQSAPSETDMGEVLNASFDAQRGEPLNVVPLSLGGLLDGLKDNIENLIIDIILEVMQKQLDAGMVIDKELMWDFYHRTPSQAFLREKMVGLVQDMIRDERTTTVTLEETRKLLEENTDLLSEYFKMPIQGFHVDVLVKLVDRSGALDILKQDGLLGLMRWIASGDSEAEQEMRQNLQETEQKLATIRKIGTVSNLVIALAVFLVLMLLTVLLNRGRAGMGLIGAGCGLTVTGLVYLIPLLAGLVQPRLLEAVSQKWLNGMFNLGGMKAAVMLALPLNAVLLVVGLVLLIAGIRCANRGKSA